VIAVDTNVIVRLLVNDDAEQARRARELFEHERVWIGATVLLETAWVLDSCYGFSADEVAAALTGLLGLPNVSVEDGEAVARALAAVAKGVEFADALHLVRAPVEVGTFVTFDASLARRGRFVRSTRLL
jgi:predicted nucleic-acid-binding protein